MAEGRDTATTSSQSHRPPAPDVPRIILVPTFLLLGSLEFTFLWRVNIDSLEPHKKEPRRSPRGFLDSASGATSVRKGSRSSSTLPTLYVGVLCNNLLRGKSLETTAVWSNPHALQKEEIEVQTGEGTW